jgi:hypothetical protein
VFQQLFLLLLQLKIRANTTHKHHINKAAGHRCPSSRAS